MKKSIIYTLLFWIFLSSAFALIGEGVKAPEFSVTSGDGNEITLRDLEGTVVVIFYETKDNDVIEKNRALKEELKQFYKIQTDLRKKLLSRIAIIDCRSASWPFKGIWKSKLIENSKKEGIPIYGDWDGTFADNYFVAKGETNFIVIDNKGIIRYANAGVIEGPEILKIKNLLGTLLSNKWK